MSVYVADFQTLRPEEPLRILDERASSLKKILSRIPDEIYDRKRFLDTIKYMIVFFLYFCIMVYCGQCFNSVGSLDIVK